MNKLLNFQMLNFRQTLITDDYTFGPKLTYTSNSRLFVNTTERTTLEAAQQQSTCQAPARTWPEPKHGDRRRTTLIFLLFY
jgi:hypothetical protein